MPKEGAFGDEEVTMFLLMKGDTAGREDELKLRQERMWSCAKARSVRTSRMWSCARARLHKLKF